MHAKSDRSGISQLFAIIILVVLFLSTTALLEVDGSGVKSAWDSVCGCTTPTATTQTTESQSVGNNFEATFQCIANCTQTLKNGTQIGVNWKTTLIPQNPQMSATFQEPETTLSPYIMFGEPINVTGLHQFVNGTGSNEIPPISPMLLQIKLYILNDTTFPYKGGDMQWSNSPGGQILILQTINATMYPSTQCSNFTLSGDYGLSHQGTFAMTCSR